MSAVVSSLNPATECTTAGDTLTQKTRNAGVSSGGHLVAKALKNAAVDTIFTLCGDHITDIYEGRVDEGIRIIDVRYQQAAAHAVDGYAPAVVNIWADPREYAPGTKNQTMYK
jgi:acetolactate synthase-1/2/3 large subunit